MDLSQMTEEQARDTVAKMFEEMRRTLNAVGDYPDSDSEYETDTEDEGNTTATVSTTADNANNATTNNTITDNTNESSGSSSNPTNHKDSDAPSKKTIDDATEEEQGPDAEKISLSYTQPPPGTITTATTNGETDEPEKKKRKKRKKTKKAKIELEDYLTVEDATDLAAEDPYDKSKTPAERVEIAVTRFRKNRKFSPIRSQILSVYLDYGGIQTGPKMFQGGGVKTGGTDDDGEVDFDAMNAGVDRVDLPEEGQEVDFTNVVTTFLSQHFLKNTGWIDMVYYKDTPVVVAALLNYFLIRDVLPEYKEDLQAALAVAEKAKVELPLCKMISSCLPSRYDKACSLLYGGEWFNYLENQWQGEAASVEVLGLDRAMAKRIVRSVVNPDVDPNTLRVGKREFLEMEITHIPAVDLDTVDADTAAAEPMPEEEDEEDDATTVDMVDRMLLGQVGKTSDEPVILAVSNGSNTATAAASVGQQAPEEVVDALMVKYVDVTLAEIDPEVSMEAQRPLSERRKVHVFFDPNVANKFLLGMRIAAYVYTLSNGMSYLEQATVMPSYYMEADEVEEPEDEWAD
ncbi:hypothetical protein BGW39_009792 [Mortierella sp. 14UC]|nr:hypothetical protein BGW39_009792 [Mortierella sp. 14UC]